MTGISLLLSIASNFWLQTKVPLPRMRLMIPASMSSVSPLLTVMRLTLNSLTISSSVGSWLPSGYTPSLIRRRMVSPSLLYTGVSILSISYRVISFVYIMDISKQNVNSNSIKKSIFFIKNRQIPGNPPFSEPDTLRTAIQNANQIVYIHSIHIICFYHKKTQEIQSRQFAFRTILCYTLQQHAESTAGRKDRS